MREWLAKAAEDLQAAEAILGAPMASFGLASFHAQQAAEKAIKAILVRHQIPFERTHDLGRLVRQADALTPGLEARLQGIDALTPYAVLSRYPMRMPPTARDTARAHLEAARSALEAVREILEGYLEGASSAT